MLEEAIIILTKFSLMSFVFTPEECDNSCLFICHTICHTWWWCFFEEGLVRFTAWWFWWRRIKREDTIEIRDLRTARTSRSA